LAVVFGTRVYTRSQILLFSGGDVNLVWIESLGLILGCVLILVGYWRSAFQEIDLYPSRAVLQTSLTVFLVGGYLIVVGGLAQVAVSLGLAGGFRIAASVLLLG